MSLAADYRGQRVWRAWPRIFDALPPVSGQTVLDLGCGVGDQAADLVERGARVIGVDMNDELLRAARLRALAGAEFRRADLRALPDLGPAVDGIWCSFAAAYFPDLASALAAWGKQLRPGGWIALTEVDDLFGHEPLGASTRAALEAYARAALAAGRYDFKMGRKLRGHLERAGFSPTAQSTVGDLELAFDGPARPDVLEAWRARLDRMTPLREACGPSFAGVRQDLLGCLAHAEHRSTAKVHCCIAVKPEPRA